MKKLTINENLKSFLNNKHEADYDLNRYKSSKVESFKYKDGTQLICIPPNSTLEVGDDFRDTKGFLYVVTDVISSRPHRGVFDEESKRWTCYIVKSEKITI
ncbi:hypothetical protein PG614_02505 [Riemerella anatipestifer]|nr:hypothetical protein [Riemerella anatipestifer]MDY3532634.1 hypothetical protein [Riemerella anatipestifer]MDY3534812.1 hypothetical protein [Riemerella anatipestifer]